MNASFASRCLLPALVVLVGLGADESGPAPKLEGQSIPNPPRQKEPWTPPQTKLPRFLVSATAVLFEQGVADPRGCDYRIIDVTVGSVRANGPGTTRTHGWVFPPMKGRKERFAVCWNGLVYPLVSFGDKADLDGDIRALADSMKASQDEAAKRGTGRQSGGFSRGPGGFDEGSAISAERPISLKLCLLLRLGRADLAESLFAAGTSWTPEVRAHDLTGYEISYLTLATDWAFSVYQRFVSAHMRGDDAIALDAARRLSAFAKAVDTKAAAMGFERVHNRFSKEPPAYFPFLRQLPELLADHERRAKEPARGPIPKRGGDPSARISALIRDLDQTAERHESMRGGFAGDPESSPLVQALVEEGQPAVEPLLTALETDMRLTRSVSDERGRMSDCKVHPVFAAELAAIQPLLDTHEFMHLQNSPSWTDPAWRKQLAQILRTYWEKNHALSLNERCYRDLRDDSAGRDPWAWVGAAGGLVALKDERALPYVYSNYEYTTHRVRLGRPLGGEEMRSRRDPSVSELMARRALEIARSDPRTTVPNTVLTTACALAIRFDLWDEKAALPVIRELMRLAREVIAQRNEQGYHQDHHLENFVAQFAIIRARGGEREGLKEYAEDIRKSDPKDAHPNFIFSRFEPMWTCADDPTIRDAARWLFNDPASPWAPLVRDPGSQRMNWLFDERLYTSPLLRSAGFRDALIAAMAIKSVMGKVRVCDHLAWRISTLGGAPECQLDWPEDRRDQAVEACIAFLKRYGDRFTADPLPVVRDFNDKTAHLTFPALGRPATLEDVRQTRAIFSLEGQRETRLIKVPQLPIQARWVTNKDFPLEVQRGWIWQAEEVRNGDRWERIFGFVGPHVIARVPAAEIELDAGPDSPLWSSLPSGLDARLESAKPSRNTYEPGQTIRVTLHLRNRRGVENTAPSEFLRRGTDGRTELRRGVALAVSYSAPPADRSDPFPRNPEDALKPSRSDRFTPGEATRSRAPFEEFEVMQLDLNEWFDMTRPGSYRVHVAFAADSGVGQGTSNNWHFTVDDPDRVVP
jgi:hypothetical protein